MALYLVRLGVLFWKPVFGIYKGLSELGLYLHLEAPELFFYLPVDIIETTLSWIS
jgi:hypothetical protein